MPDDQTFGDFVLTTLSSRLIRQSTAQSYVSTVKHLGLWNTPMSEITVAFLYQTLETITNPNTKRKHIVALRALLRDTVPGVKVLKIPRAVPKIYTLAEEDTIRFALMLSPYEFYGLLMMYAGLRIGEACAVTAGDVKGNILTVNKQRYETGRVGQAKTTGDVIIPNWLADRIRTHVYKDVTPGSVRESFRRNGLKVGIDLGPHMLRHWYATKMMKNRINPEIARRQLRHSDLKTTLGIYAQVAHEDIEKVIDDLFE